MKRGAAISVIILGLAGGTLCASALAESGAVGGPKKPVAVGGPVKQASPVVPPPKGGAAPVPPPTVAKCAGAACGQPKK